ncbi:hypothetical protein BELL_0064g00280 [Botrytis elliptica]|uniref:Formylmethionine deformylase protein n=1 Tax=Botrytis elliptica TaxID=278938 RepID=A0A4Z1K3G1_9HELO|nr:hypothetical protein EAE99_010678 [Botrytis elliptica]TGO78520.1 hypothetical protein BELL_0064g00280 [Botrytis elliptica]
MAGQRTSYPMSSNHYLPMSNHNHEASDSQDVIEMKDQRKESHYLPKTDRDQESSYTFHTIEMEDQRIELHNLSKTNHDQETSYAFHTIDMEDEEKRPYPVRMDSLQSTHSTKSGHSNTGRSHSTIRPFDTQEEDLVGNSEPSHHHQHHDGIFWRSPILMGGNLFIGIIASIAHHVFYSCMVGKQVGDDFSQQWTLRYGTTFAFVSQVCLVSSVGFAYTQWLWKSLYHKDTKVSVNCLDAAFVADTSVLSILNTEMLWKLKLGSLIAIAAWCLPIGSLLTPGTLYVVPSTKSIHTYANVSSLDMYGHDQPARFTYSAPVNVTDGVQNELFLGPRTIITRLSTATATQGEILPINAPFSNATYDVQFYGPIVKCNEADSTTATIIQNLRDESVANITGSVTEVSNYYYAFVPNLGNYDNSSLPNHGVTVIPQARLQQPQNASNQLWMGYSRYTRSRSFQTENHYTVCTLYNASYNININFEEGIQTVTSKSLSVLNSVPYPDINTPLSNSLMVQHAYSAYMWSIADLMVGTMGIFQAAPSAPGLPSTYFSEITTQIAHTSLLGSSDLDAFFERKSNDPLGNNNTAVSDQRAQDISLAGNATLEELVEELAWNVTCGFLNSNLLSPSVNTSVLSTTSINIYAYHSSTLLLSYGIAIFVALIANSLGAYAYHINGRSHNKSFSAILAATRDSEFGRLLPGGVRGKIPLPEWVLETQLRFVDVDGGEVDECGMGGKKGGGREFRVVGMKKGYEARRGNDPGGMFSES